MKIGFYSAYLAPQPASSILFPATSYRTECVIEEKAYTADEVSQQVFSQPEMPDIATHTYFCFLSLTGGARRCTCMQREKCRALLFHVWMETRSYMSPKIKEARLVLRIFFTPPLSFMKQVCEKKSFFHPPFKLFIPFTEIMLVFFLPANSLGFYIFLHQGRLLLLLLLFS